MTSLVTDPSQTLDPLLLDVAERQQGMFTTSQAQMAGIGSYGLSRLVRGRVLTHPGRGLYAVAAMVDSDPRGWHRQLTIGARLLHDDIVITGVTALVAHDVALWRADLTRPQILRPVQRASTLACLHLRPDRGVTTVDSALGPSVSLAHALAQFALDRGIEPAVVSMDHALHSGVVSQTDLEQSVGELVSWPRSSRARSALGLCDGRRESVAESRTGVALATGGIAVTPQVEIRDQSGWLVGRIDFLVDGTKLIVEVDGKVKYASGDPAVLYREKRREDAVRRLGFRVVRITWADLERPGRVVAKVRAALAG